MTTVPESGGAAAAPTSSAEGPSSKSSKGRGAAKPCKGPTTACHVIGSGNCCCFSRTFIQLYKDIINTGSDDLPCFDVSCSVEIAATHGAHVRTKYGVRVFILPCCQKHNKPKSGACAPVREDYQKAGAALKITCCCFVPRQGVCNCKKGNSVCHCDPLGNPKVECTCDSP